MADDFLPYRVWLGEEKTNQSISGKMSADFEKAPNINLDFSLHARVEINCNQDTKHE